MITIQADTGELKDRLDRIEMLLRGKVRHGTYQAVQHGTDMPAYNGKPFARLRQRLGELGMEHSYLADKLGMVSATLSKRMTGKLQWELSEMYAVMDVLQLPYEQMSEFFPKGGMSSAPVQKNAQRRIGGAA